ncbi:MAG TPA: single-stranded-DNA-specific exonuclease RecJ [Gammaproteobacteria bacterium]|nr:single-stranded-DNA-specific exonuclease RecJ [Gammaproteobacteria bacterium]
MKKSIVRRASIEHSNLPDTLHPVLRRIYANRHMDNADELEKSLAKLLPFQKLKNIDLAARFLYDALKQQAHFLVVGDFDADGATSTCVAVKCLKMMGAKQVNFLVPDRFKYGYGLTPEIVEKAVSDFSPDIIITVDNGISSIDGVTTAKSHGIDVIVTDHHLAGNQLPEANAIVNPNQAGDQFASKNLAGVGVIFYLMLALRHLLRLEKWFERQQIKEPNLGSVLDIIALGTVADVVPLDFNNRILVNQGIKRIRAGRACPGIQALIEISNRNPQTLVAGDLGYCIGPRLNAAGRLENMATGIACLLSESLHEARQYAMQLNQLNQERRAIESQMQQEALHALKLLNLDNASESTSAIAIYDENWHQGVIGILASRIKDKFHRPVIVFANGDNNEIKGSARSIKHIHIRDVLDHIATSHPGLIKKFGGHAMAAGLTISKNDFTLFNNCFTKEVQRLLKPEYLEQVIYSDGELARDEFNLTLAELLKNAEPWGQAFPEPVFDGTFKLTQQRIVGEKHLKLSLKNQATIDSIDAIAFNAISEEDQASPLTTGMQIQVAYKLDVNEFRGKRSLQLVVEHFEPV